MAENTGPTITEQINTQFNVCPLRTSLGKEWTNTDYESCTFDSLATAGVGVHEFDGTTYMPVPWIQQMEQGHTDQNSSGGIANNWTRTSNLPNQPAGTDGVISVYVEGFEKLPDLGVFIDNTSLVDKAGGPLVTLMCSYDSDAGDDNRTGNGCGCMQSAFGTAEKPGACYGVPSDITPEACSTYAGVPGDLCKDVCPTCSASCVQAHSLDIDNQPEACYQYMPTDDCDTYRGNRQVCKNVCQNCNNWCNTDGTSNSVQCAYKPTSTTTNTVQPLMEASIAACQGTYNAGLGTDCYNEILIDVRQWTKKTLVPGRTPTLYTYTALPEFYPQAIWAFGYPKWYGTPLTPVPITTPAPGHGQIFATRAWSNYNFLYPDANAPLVEFDPLIPVNTTGDTEAFSEICDGVSNDSDACKAAMYLAGVSDADGSKVVDFLICDPGRTASVVGTPETGILAQCLCPNGQPPDYTNSCN